MDEATHRGLEKLQRETQAWRVHNFPQDVRTPVHQALGCCEEAGEGARAVLKMEQGIRGTEADLREQLIDAIGDFCIYAMGLGEWYGFTIGECIETAWDEVKDRDWVQFPENGVDR